MKISLRQIGYLGTWSLSGLVHSIPEESGIGGHSLIRLRFPGRCQIYLTVMKEKKILNSIFPGYPLVGGEGNTLTVSH